MNLTFGAHFASGENGKDFGKHVIAIVWIKDDPFDMHDLITCNGIVVEMRGRLSSNVSMTLTLELDGILELQARPDRFNPSLMIFMSTAHHALKGGLGFCACATQG